MRHEQFVEEARRLGRRGGRLLTLAGTQLDSGEVELRYHFELGDQMEVLTLVTVERRAPSLASRFPVADFPEREASRRFRLQFVDAPPARAEP